MRIPTVNNREAMLQGELMESSCLPAAQQRGYVVVVKMNSVSISMRK